MTLGEAMAAHGPAWLGIWLPALAGSIFLLPLLLFIWKGTRITAVICLVFAGLGAFGVGFLYARMGYVRLLGLPHIVFWTPLAIYLFRQIRLPDIPHWPRRIMGVILVMVSISLAFDYVDALRYLAGERTPLAFPPAAT